MEAPLAFFCTTNLSAARWYFEGSGIFVTSLWLWAFFGCAKVLGIAWHFCHLMLTVKLLLVREVGGKVFQIKSREALTLSVWDIFGRRRPSGIWLRLFTATMTNCGRATFLTSPGPTLLGGPFPILKVLLLISNILMIGNYWISENPQYLSRLIVLFKHISEVRVVTPPLDDFAQH